MSLTSTLHRRAHRQGLDGHARINKQRRTALILVVTGLIRASAWTTLIVLYLVGVSFTTHLFQSVAFVAIISLYANAATDFGQVCASLAQLAAGDAHHDAEAVRREGRVDFTQIEEDIARLAKLQPGPESDELVLSIHERLHE